MIQFLCAALVFVELASTADSFTISSLGVARQSGCSLRQRCSNGQTYEGAIPMNGAGNEQNGIDDPTTQSILNQALLSVDTCTKLHQKFLNNENGSNEQERIVFIDASWWHKGDWNGRKMFEDGPRIKGSYYIDIDDISSKFDLYPTLNPKNLPHMMPPSDLFAAFMDEYNISNQDHIIIYGRETVLFTPRTWFMFKSFGHDPARIHLMQGSLEEWIAVGGAIERHCITVPKAEDIILNCQRSNAQTLNYIASKYASYVCSMEDVLNTIDDETHKNKEDSNYMIIDSRGSSFVKGCIPNSCHVPYSKLMDPNNTLKLKSKNNLNQVFMEAGVNPCTDKMIICSCGSGVSACTVFLALEQCGRNMKDQPTFVYDGSWSEWGNESNVPKVSS